MNFKFKKLEKIIKVLINVVTHVFFKGKGRY